MGALANKYPTNFRLTSTNKMCEHNYVFTEKIKKEESGSRLEGYATFFVFYNVFFCSKCLSRELIKDEFTEKIRIERQRW